MDQPKCSSASKRPSVKASNDTTDSLLEPVPRHLDMTKVVRSLSQPEPLRKRSSVGPPVTVLESIVGAWPTQGGRHGARFEPQQNRRVAAQFSTAGGCR